jgi:hypothetical protein
MKNILKNNYNHTLKQGYSNPNLMYNLGLKHTLPKKQFSRKKKKKKKKKKPLYKPRIGQAISNTNPQKN